MNLVAGRLRARWSGLPAELRGQLLILVSTFAFATMHAVIRHLSKDLHPFEVAFFRNLFGFFALTPFFLRGGRAVFRTGVLHLHALRGLLQVGAMLSFFFAVSVTPLAKVSALSFTAPLFAAIGAVLLLRERLRLSRFAALAAGFVGALAIVRPGVAPIDFGALLVLGSSAVWAVCMLVIKLLARTESSVTITAYMGVFLTPLSGIAALFVWRWPSPEHLIWFIVMGGLGTFAHLAFSQAFKEADATAVLPFDFTRLIWASLLGFWLYAEVPEFWTWAGGALIFASATYIAIHEARTKKAAALRAS
jgi:drug/metabolite transporter (DMT)-like permease